MRKTIIALMAGCVFPFVTSATTAEAITPRRLLEIVDLGNPVMSPDGHHVAFRVEQANVNRNTYDATWYVQDMDGASAPRRVGNGGVPLRDSAGGALPSSATWSPDGRGIYYRALLGGKVDVWKAAADGSGAQPVTHDAADVRGFKLSADGKVLMYSVGATREEVMAAEQAEYDRGIRIDASVPVGQALFRSGLVDGRPMTQRYVNSTFDRMSLLADMPDRWKAIDLLTGKRWNVEAADVPRSARDELRLPRGMPEPDEVVRDPRSERLALLSRIRNGDREDGPSTSLSVVAAAGTGRPIQCAEELCTNRPVTDIQWSPSGDSVLFTITEPDDSYAQSIARWNVHSGDVRLVASSRGLMNGGDRYGEPSACGVSPIALACVVAEANVPPRLERIDLKTGKRRVLFDPNAALAHDLARITPVTFLHWTDANGQLFTGQFYPARAPAGRRPPLFINYYTCRGFLRGGMGDEWPLATLAEDGISALCINSPSLFENDAVKRYNQGLTATKSVVSLLASRGEIDPNKVGMGGLSFGSEVAVWVAIKSNLLAAVSATSPSASPIYYLISALKGEATLQNLKKVWGLGAPGETPERWKVLSPVFNLDKIHAPMLFQMPEQEYIQALDYTIPLMREHRADVYVFPDEAHQKFQPVHKLAAYERNVDWFRFWLQGYEDPDPIKAAQYSNWRRMRE